MQIRYDLNSVSDFSNVRKQTSFFLSKEDCLFSFYLKQIAVNFTINRNSNDKFDIKLNFSELSEQKENGMFKRINPHSDYRLKELSFIQELFVDDGSGIGYTEKDNVAQVVDFMIHTVKFFNKVKDLSLIA